MQEIGHTSAGGILKKEEKVQKKEDKVSNG
jgi:hypothetical protein